MNPPKRNTKRWNKILAAGCGGQRDYWGDYDCLHRYDWTCDDCPCCIDNQTNGTDEVESIELIIPPKEN